MTVSPSQIRADFSAAMSEMYRTEVPAYGTLVGIVEDVNAAVLERDDNALALTPGEDTNRISAERHGAIRLGTAEELAMMGRVFAVMGMEPVGYCDLSVASVPVHSTAFRPIGRDALAENPFRVFTSLLRLELIEDEALREKAAATLARRRIFTEGAIALTEKAEAEGGLSAADAARFVAEVLETFRWHPEACVDDATFEDLIGAHRLIADVVSFKGPHINHLTPRTLDIDAAQAEMVAQGLPAKAIVEGPPRRTCPILLRQTAFKALNEAIRFPVDGGWQEGQHTARFGEIEQRGVALTPKGRALYDSLLTVVRADILPAADGSNAEEYVAKLEEVFAAFPDSWRALHDQGLAYFKYGIGQGAATGDDLPSLLDAGALTISPIIYEDFLPVSAAGIFQSNLGDEARSDSQAASSRAEFEAALGKPVTDEFALYEAMQAASCAAALEQLNASAA
ncbi:VOC family protein [Mameliella sp. CS4]|uniref:2-oxoadipate dioxygenase/decarboxylase HglS n=1 Tax=Mameliella sp. CS4 TaxID=2862329 RepID=UPI001C5FF8A7|nr:VOC family protein [Mameliella sp. CS4]MBW4983605.1 VOC family protein [Mameliella sp. CS4]